MKVKAVFRKGKFGFYCGKMVHDGDVFTLSDSAHFSSIWMRAVELESAKQEDSPGIELPAPQTPDIDWTAPEVRRRGRKPRPR